MYRAACAWANGGIHQVAAAASVGGAATGAATAQVPLSLNPRMLPVCAPWAQAQLGMGSVPVRPASSSAAGAAASPARSHAPLLQTVAEREARRKHHQRLSRSCASAGDDILPSSSPACSSSATSSGGGGGGGGGGTRARGTTAAPPSSDLRSLRGVGPANEELLRQRSIHKLDDLADLYRRECGSDPGVLAKFLLVTRVGVGRQGGSSAKVGVCCVTAGQGEGAGASDAVCCQSRCARAIEEREPTKLELLVRGGGGGGPRPPRSLLLLSLLLSACIPRNHTVQSAVGIRRQHSDMIASALQHWAEQHAAESEAAAAGPAHVTLAVEGNISAGWCTA